MHSCCSCCTVTVTAEKGFPVLATGFCRDNDSSVPVQTSTISTDALRTMEIHVWKEGIGTRVWKFSSDVDAEEDAPSVSPLELPPASRQRYWTYSLRNRHGWVAFEVSYEGAPSPREDARSPRFMKGVPLVMENMAIELYDSEWDPLI